MNYKFRKKPIVIEAFQMTKDRRYDNMDWPEWLHEAWNKAGGAGAMYIFDAHTDHLCIGTLEGVLLIGWDDWIIRGVNGELYPCKPDIFEKTYEEVIDG